MKTFQKTNPNKFISIISILLVVLLSFSILSGCGVTEPVEVEVEKEKTPIEELTEQEKLLFDALIKISNTYPNPASLKLLEVGDYGEIDSIDIGRNYMIEGFGTIWDSTPLGKGRFLIGLTAKLQYENDNAETVSKYFNIRLDTLEKSIVEKEDPDSDYYCTKEEAEKAFGNHCVAMEPIKTNNEDIFNISKINKALKYYWDERLGNT